MSLRINHTLAFLLIAVLVGSLTAQRPRPTRRPSPTRSPRSPPGFFRPGTILINRPNVGSPFGPVGLRPFTRAVTTTTTTTAAPVASSRPPPAPAQSGNDAPRNGLTIGIKVPPGAEINNIGKATGTRASPPPTSETTRPNKLEKDGSMKPKNRIVADEVGNDQPTGQGDDKLQRNLFEKESVSPQRVTNVQPQPMPGAPEALVKPSTGNDLRGRPNGPDDGNDRPSGSLNTVSTTGHEFWIAFLDNRVEQPLNQPLEIYLTATHYDAGITASVRMWYMNPYTEDLVYDETTLASDAVKILTVPAYMKNVVNGIFPKGIRIVSDQPIGVYAFNYEPFSADAFRVLPIDALSSHYIAVTFPQPFIRTQIVCLALRDDTIIRFQLPKSPPADSGLAEPVVDMEGLRYFAGESFNLTVNAFEVISIRSVGDLTGTSITSTDKIACFSGNVRAHVSVGSQGYSRDHLVSQLPPVSSWGSEFVIGPVPSLRGSLGEVHMIVTSQADTTIVVSESGRPQRTYRVPEAFDKIIIPPLRNFALLEADKPVQVAQIFGSQKGANAEVQGDPSMSLVSPINQYSASPQTTFPPDGAYGYDNSILIVIDRDQRSGLRVSRKRNSNVENRNWNNIPGTRLVARFLSTSQERLTQIWHTNPSVKFYIRYYGFADRESYTYPGTTDLHVGCDWSTVIAGDNIDNDCDGETDEEIIDGIDNDGDGLIDEDTGHRHPYELTGGKEYVLVFMENHAVSFSQQIHLYMDVSADAKSETVTVEISQPRRAGTTTQTVNLRAGRYSQIALSPDDYTIYGTTKSDKTILIKASDRIVLIALNRKLFSQDGNLVTPVDRLGMNYYTVSYSPSHVATQFAVVATEDNTVIDITFPPEVVNKPWADGAIQVPWGGFTWTNGHHLQITLAKYEALQMQSGYDLETSFENREERGDLTGTHISSDKPFAVFSGNGRVNTLPSRSRDHLVEQLPPVETWGTEYIVTPTPERTIGEFYKIIASQPNTKVIVDRSDNAYQQFDLNEGEFIQVDINTGGVSAAIYGDKPIMVVMFMKSQQGPASSEEGDPAMIVISHLQQWVYNVRFGTPLADYQEFFVTVVLQRKYRSGLRFNGDLVPAGDFRDTPRLGRRQYAYVVLSVQQGRYYTLTHDDASAAFFPQLYGKRDRESVGYVLGVNLPILNPEEPMPQPFTPIPGGFTLNNLDHLTVELCGDDIDNDGDFLKDEDCDHAHEYYAMFMTNTVREPMDHSLEIHCVSTSNQNYVRLTTGHINKQIARHEVEKNIIKEITLNRDESVIFVVPGHYRAQLSRSGYFDLQFKGVVVESDWALECFAFNKETGSADGWLMSDYYDLGLHYVVSSAWPYQNRQLVGMVAPDDDTLVSVTLAPARTTEVNRSYVDIEGQRYFAGETFEVNLKRLQIFQLDVWNGYDLTGTLIISSKPLAVFSGNERTGLPYGFSVGYDHAANQLPPIPTTASAAGYRYDVVPTNGATTNDQYQCVGFVGGTTVEFKQNGVSRSSLPLNTQGVVSEILPTNGGLVQITANNPLMCEQFVFGDPENRGNSPELAGNVLANVFTDSRPWYRFVIPQVSRLNGHYNASIAVTFSLNQLFDGEAVAFFMDGSWLDNIAPKIVGDVAYFRVWGVGTGFHSISSAIVDVGSNQVVNAVLRFTIQVYANGGDESIAYSPVPEQLYSDED